MKYRKLVHIQVFFALIVIALVEYLGLIYGNEAWRNIEELSFLALIYAIPLGFAILLVMFERAESPDYILGYCSSVNNSSLRCSFLQNTLEQTFFSFLSVVAFEAVAPNNAGGVIIAALFLFFLGRFLFLIGYVISPMWRFFGFSINYYSSVFLLLAAVWYKWQ